MKADRQLRLVRPERRVRTARLTPRQQVLLATLREAAGPMSIAELDARWTQKFHGRAEPDRLYRHMGAALGRLADRKLVVRVRRGVYRAVEVRERKL